MARHVDKQAQEDRISEAVWTVLATRGVEGLTLRAVATVAGCTTGLVLHRFANRRELLRHARTLLFTRVQARVERIEAERASPAEALRAILMQGMAVDDAMAEETRVWAGFLVGALGDEELIAVHRRNNRAWQERVVRLVRATDPTRSADEAWLIARALIAVTDGAGTLAIADPESYDPATQRAMLDATLTAFGLLSPPVP